MVRRSRCANCSHDLSGRSEIADPGEQPSEPPYFTQAIGVEVPSVGDGILFWTCPFCGFAWALGFSCPEKSLQAEMHAWKWNRQNHVDVERGHAVAIGVAGV